MKMIKYPIIFILSFFAFLSISLIVGFLFFKFILLLFVIGFVIVLGAGFYYLYQKLNDDTDNKDWRKVAKEVRDIAKKNKL